MAEVLEYLSPFTLFLVMLCVSLQTVGLMSRKRFMVGGRYGD